jgi:hypothetical protein
MVVRADDVLLSSRPVAADVLTVRRAALWTMLAAKMLAGWGVRWDIQWHVAIGRDSFWIPPHLMTYAGVTVVVLVSFGILFWETARSGLRPRPMRLGLAGNRGFHVAAWGIAVTVAAAPIDDLWHRLFGLDITLWSPPHLLGFLGAAINSLGCLLIAREVYAEGSRARLIALVVSAAWLFGSIHPTLEPASLTAYRHGGVRFHTYAMLAALLLPLALVPAARLTRHRWAPLFLLATITVSSMAGEQVAHAGFAWLRPTPLTDAELASDPGSDVALAREIGRKIQAAPGGTRSAMRFLGLLPALLMVAVDARRRPVSASLAYAVAVFALNGWSLAWSPAFAPVVPSLAETGVALVVTVATAIVGGLAGDRLADVLATRPKVSGLPEARA